MYIYLNGQIQLDEEAKISVYDHGFMYGLGLFETFRVYQGHPFLLKEHLERLRKGLEELHIHWSISDNEVLEIIQELLHKNNLQDAYIRLNVSAGAEGLGLITHQYQQPTTIFYIKPLPAMITEKRGVILQTVRNTPEGQERLKSHHYLNNIIGKRELGQAADKEGIFLTKEGYIAEGVVSNIFWIKDGRVYTPSLKTGILNGITRSFVIELLRRHRIHCEEGFYTVESIMTSDEAFITNSIQEIVALTQINEKALPGLNGKLVNLLLNDYNSYKRKLLSIKEL